MFRKTVNPDGKTAIVHDRKGNLLGTVSLQSESVAKNVANMLDSEETFSHSLSGVIPESFHNIDKVFSRLNKHWEGHIVGQEMFDAGDKNWAQIEWIGWGFEFWAKNNLNTHFQIHETIDGENKTLFDAHHEFPWDFKTHVLHNAKGKHNKLTPLNDKAAIDEALNKYGQVGFVIVEGEATFGSRFEQWRMSLKGTLSKAQLRNKQEGRRSRERKDSFTVKNVNFYVITKEDMEQLQKDNIMSIFKQGRQADGTPRNQKYNFDSTKVKPSMQITF